MNRKTLRVLPLKNGQVYRENWGEGTRLRGPMKTRQPVHKAFIAYKEQAWLEQVCVGGRGGGPGSTDTWTALGKK